MIIYDIYTIYKYVHIYLCELKVLQYLGNMSHNSAAPGAFAPDVIKVINHIRLENAELPKYNPSAFHRIRRYGLEHGLGMHCFKPIWPCLIVEVLVALVKFLEQFG